jgi:CheY-like chemotaxis protein
MMPCINMAKSLSHRHFWPMGHRMGAAKKIKVRSTEKIKLLVAEDDRQQARRLVDFFNQNGFEARATVSGTDAKSMLMNWKPKVVVADLLLPGMNAFEMLRYIKSEPSLVRHNITVVIVSSHNDPTNVNEAFRRGARDFIVRPYLYQDLLNRVVLQCRDPRFVQPYDEKETAAHWNLADLILTQAMQMDPLQPVLFNITQMIGKKMSGVRCSIVRTTTLSEGQVIASSDDPKVSGLKLDLTKYPEIQLVVNTKKTIAIDNLANSRALKAIKDQVKTISFNSMIVCPLIVKGSIFGVLSLRLPDSKKKLSEEDLRFMDMSSKIVSLAIGARDLGELARFGLISA